MPSTIRVTTASKPSIVVIQQAYQEFCTPREPAAPIAYNLGSAASSASAGFVVIAAEQQIVFATDPSVENWLNFKRLTKEWHAQRGVTSSITEAAMCPAYQTIIGMGRLAIPFILAQLNSEGDEPDQWFWALKAITGADPVRDEDRGNYLAMARSWLNWAESEAHAW